MLWRPSSANPRPPRLTCSALALPLGSNQHSSRAPALRLLDHARLRQLFNQPLGPRPADPHPPLEELGRHPLVLLGQLRRFGEARIGRLLLPAPERADASTEAESLAVDPVSDPTIRMAVHDDGLRPEVEVRDEAPAAPPEPEAGGGEDGRSPLAPALPDVLDREQARRTVTEEYPVALERAGIGGVVRLLLWVSPDGIPESPEVSSSSGVPGLDKAALRAVSLIRFQPATRAGLPVGTWVEFSIRFVPSATGSQPAPENQAFEIPPIS